MAKADRRAVITSKMGSNEVEAEAESQNTNTRKVAYIWSQEYEQSSRIHSLIRAYGLDKLMTIVEPKPASVEELCTFHDEEYIQFLLSTQGSPPPRSKKRKRSKSLSSSDSSSSEEPDPYENYGLEYDCPPFDNLPRYISLLGGAAIQSASLLPHYTHVLHWDAGRHHAQHDAARGYCYLADIPLTILHLLPKYKNVLYIDLDVHHGDGVEFAFSHTEKVVTLSFHVFEQGFFPGTGSGEENGKGVYNVPLERGMKGAVWEETVKRGVEVVYRRYDPECVIVQCGCDGLLTDPHKGLQLTTHHFRRAIDFILHLAQGKGILLLGGGGYHPPSTAKHFAVLTALVLGQELDEEIPVEAEYWEELEKDGGIHVGRDSQITKDGEEEVERLCTALKEKIDKK